MMQYQEDSFLSLLASRCINQYGAELHQCCFVFPSQRAGTFFRYELSKRLTQPSFSPQIITVESLTEKLSGLKSAQRTQQVCLLYREIVTLREELGFPLDEQSNPHLPFDHAEKLLSDFNDIDNYLVEPDEIFHNLKALDNLTSLDYISPEQREAIEIFFGRLSKVNSDKKERLEELFSAMTSEMQLLYHRFRATLESLGLGYSGMLARRATELSEEVFDQNLQKLLSPSVRHIIVAGLYHLSTAEREILKRLKRSNNHYTTSFYWEEVKLANHTTPSDWSFLIGKTMQESKQELGGEWLSPQEKGVPKIDVVQIPSDIGRSKLVPTLLQELIDDAPRAVEDLQCAIVLPEVNTLLPLLDALQGISHPINITMGYPLHLSSMAVWLHRYIELQQFTRWSEKGELLPLDALEHLIKHPLSNLLVSSEELSPLNEALRYNYYYISYQEICTLYPQGFPEPLRLLIEPISEKSALIQRLVALLDELASLLQEEDNATEEEDSKGDSNHVHYIRVLEIEFIKKLRDLVIQVGNLLPLMGDTAERTILYRLLFKLVEEETLPFEGEPLEGLQIMGFLESRLINFDYLIIPESNEGALPHKRPINRGYIPYNVRLGYNMPTYQSDDYTEAYYFYRLISRARRVFFIVDSRSEKEPSRFLAQLRYLFHLTPQEHTVKVSMLATQTPKIVIPKDEEAMEVLREYTTSNRDDIKKALSASSLSTYALCPLQFYYKYIRQIPEIEERTDLLSPGDFGTVIHDVMQHLYKPYEGKLLSSQDYEWLIDPHTSLPRISTIVNSYYAQNVLHQNSTPKEIEGMHQMYIRMIMEEVYAVLKFDAQYIRRGHQLAYMASEQRIDMIEPLPELRIDVRFKGFIDRLDEVDGLLRIVDYKTGSDSQTFKDWNQLYFAQEKSQHRKAIAQIFLYSEAILRLVENGRAQQEGLNWLQPRNNRVQPSLYQLKGMCSNKESYNPLIRFNQTEIEDYATSEIRDSYCHELHEVLLRLFSPDVPFAQTEDEEVCRYCAFKAICAR
ncbi:MAG: PD-(D/E)XK nuclease family protein [Porphyromonas endodontalis]|uniref:PD-(D/E)XK nuclease family protein n=1 Tax=Porphyromonas endodontalis TaxID=28124 RepID=UPI00361A7C8C